MPRNPTDNTDPTPAFDPFATLGLPRKLVLDEKKLQQIFLAHIKNNHPDRVHELGPQTRNEALQSTMLLNQAYAILKDPYQRVIALLDLEKIARAGSINIPSDFFYLVIEVKQLVNQYEQTSAAKIRERLVELTTQIDQYFINKAGELKQLMREFDEKKFDDTKKHLMQLKHAAEDWRYLANLKATLDQALAPR